MYTLKYEDTDVDGTLATLDINHKATGVLVATITVEKNGILWYADHMHNKEYILIEIEQSGMVVVDKPTLD